ncbi:MAG: STAS domain-containing protein [Candidatus Acidiferrales bacterium]
MCHSRRFGYPLPLMPPFTLDVEKTAGSTADVTVYQLKGKLSLETVAGFIPQMRQESARRVILDMSGVNFLDSAGRRRAGFAVCEPAESREKLCAGSPDSPSDGGRYRSGIAEAAAGFPDR